MYDSEISHPYETVRVSCPNCGYDSDREQVAKLLDVNKTYTIVKRHVHSSSTEVWLKEVPGKSFNSVHFEKVYTLGHIESAIDSMEEEITTYLSQIANDPAAVVALRSLIKDMGVQFNELIDKETGSTTPQLDYGLIFEDDTPVRRTLTKLESLIAGHVDTGISRSVLLDELLAEGMMMSAASSIDEAIKNQIIKVEGDDSDPWLVLV